MDVNFENILKKFDRKFGENFGIILTKPRQCCVEFIEVLVFNCLDSSEYKFCPTCGEKLDEIQEI